MTLKVAPFRFDVTPPVGHSLCGGWIKPVVAIDDPLEAIGFVLLGADDPMVVCSLDWCGVLNSAHVTMRDRWAAAAGTTAERVAIHTVHQHNAPFVCLDAQRLVARHADIPSIVDLDFWERCLSSGESAIKHALRHASPVTHVRTGQANVEKVASNRRFLNADGKVSQWRGSSTRDAGLQALPEGLIDPALRTVMLCDGDQPKVAIHHYATHPMSYYGDGRVTADFAGLARRQREKDDPSITRIYLTGCAGNVAPGKYNDGTPQSRIDLTARLYDAIKRSEEHLSSERISSVRWRTAEFLAPPREGASAEVFEKQVADSSRSLAFRTRPAMQWAWLKRWEQGKPGIIVSSLAINHVLSLHLPGECFIEYQLRWAKESPDHFVLTVAYGDGGPWYIPTAECYPQGGYEVEQAFCESAIEARMSEAVKSVTS
jgi:hypothetical protein